MKKVLMLTVFVSAFSALPALAEDTPPVGSVRFFEKMDLDSDGVVTKEEFLKAHEERFTKMDADGDGKITKDEAVAMKRAMHEKREGAVPGSEGEDAKTESAEPAPAPTGDAPAGASE